MISLESNHNPEMPTKEYVAVLFKQQGPSLEAEASLKVWYEHMQKEADESKKPYSRLEVMIEFADLLAECNLVVEANKYVHDALYELEAEDLKDHDDESYEILVELHKRILAVENKLS